MQTPFVRFHTPCLTSQVSIEYMMSAVRTEQMLNHHGVNHVWSNKCGDPFIAKARSNAVCDFLRSEAETDFFFLDDDLGWPPEKVLEFIHSDAPIIAGAYPQKTEDTSWPCALEAGDNGLIGKGGLYKAMLAPTGFMRIKRWVLEKLYEKAPPYTETYLDGERENRAVFVCGPSTDGKWWGEDYSFCNQCSAEGISIWIDPDIDFYHRGTKRWANNMSASVAVFEEKAAAHVARTRSQAA
jgi:hypothetical protein